MSHAGVRGPGLLDASTESLGAEDAIFVLVDGSNVVYARGKPPRIIVLRNVIKTLRNAGLEPVTLVDATLRHRIDDVDSLEEMIEAREVAQTPAGRTADEFLKQLALRLESRGMPVYILTNDAFRDDSGLSCPRIAYLSVPVGDVEELLFSPTLESILVRHSSRCLAEGQELGEG